MSTKPTLVPQPEPPEETPELTDAYRKAHKNYVLASGLLASWELIGVTIETKEKWGIELKSPSAVPLILLTLVIYSGYKTAIEWWQCNAERKKHPAAKWDYRIAHMIAASAIAISVVQYLLHIQIVDVIQRHEWLVFFGLILSQILYIFLSESKKTKAKQWGAIFTVLFATFAALQGLASRMYWLFYITAPLIPLLILALVMMLRKKPSS